MAMKQVSIVGETMNDNIRSFALKNRYIFDRETEVECLKNKKTSSVIIGTHYDKIWVDLMFCLSEKYYAEAEALIISSKLPNPPMGLFESTEMVKMPPKIMRLLWQHLGNIIEVAGYDNKEDFLEDYGERLTRGAVNTTMKNIIETQLAL